MNEICKHKGITHEKSPHNNSVRLPPAQIYMPNEQETLTKVKKSKHEKEALLFPRSYWCWVEIAGCRDSIYHVTARQTAHGINRVMTC